ncbi:MAG: hypothetical protein ACHQHO_04365 [Solirubrobacterales bacterium]
MKGIRPFAAAIAIAALSAAPALASSQADVHRPAGVPHNGSSNPGKTSNPSGSHSHSTPGPNATPPAKAKAYGVYCAKESKRHVAGQKGTPFSQCVTAMAKLATNATGNPAKACSTESKKHVAGQPGTPFSRCVSAAAKLQAGHSSD